MYREKSVLAVIPARGGSKGLPGKNIKILADKPMITWSIEAAKQSEYVDRVIVSTEDEEISQVSLEYGAEIPFLRPKKLALDDTPSSDAILYTIERLQRDENVKYDIILLLQPTSPLRTCRHIDEAIKGFIDKWDMFDSAISVSELEHPVYWNRIVGENKELKNYLEYDKNQQTRRQNFDKLYRLNGAVYLAKTEIFAANKSFECEKSMAYVMDKQSSVDVDDIEDFKLAEYYIRTMIG